MMVVARCSISSTTAMTPPKKSRPTSIDVDEDERIDGLFRLRLTDDDTRAGGGGSEACWSWARCARGRPAGGTDVRRQR
jgi:hypothetical protein